MQYALELKNVHYAYHTLEGETYALKDITFSVREDKSKTWMERKSATIERLKTAPIEVQMIGLADKLSNMRDIDRDYPVCGEELWNRFRMKDKATIGWYYKGVREALREAFAETEAFAEYCSLIDKNFG